MSHIHIVSAKETPYTLSTDSNEVPVSVVDMDVPVTAIDEVLDDYGHNIIENEATPLRRTESAGSKGRENNVLTFETSSEFGSYLCVC